MKTNKMFAIAANYVSVVVWTCDPKTRQRISTSTHAIHKGLDRQTKHQAIGEILRQEGLKAPAYVPTKCRVS